jgi:putative SOS response-associated peptidase YedK
MCGRITSTFEFSDIRVRWNLDRDLPLYTHRFNVAPETSPNVPVIVRQRGGNECRLMHWGLIPSWAADPSIGNRMINARAETLTELPSFKPLVDRRRCIIPADGFYEWRKEGKRKVPMWVHLKTKEPFGLAGLWDVGASQTAAKSKVLLSSRLNLMNSCDPFTIACPRSYARTPKSNGLMLLEHHSQKPNHCYSLTPKI